MSLDTPAGALGVTRTVADSAVRAEAEMRGDSIRWIRCAAAPPVPPQHDHDTNQVATCIHLAEDRNIPMNGKSSRVISAAPSAKAGCSRWLRNVS